MSYEVRVKVLLREGSADWELLADKTHTLAQRFERGAQVQNAAAVLWDADTDGNMASFDLLILYTDVVVDLEFTTNDGDAAEELCTVRLSPGSPLILGADDSYYNHSASDAFGGSLDVIDRIRVKESNNALATVSLRAWKA